jgi:hypothetical protein
MVDEVLKKVKRLGAFAGETLNRCYEPGKRLAG